MPLDFLSAFTIGFLGSAHCIGMCGGITTMLTSAIPAQQSRASLVIAYHIGRISTYTLIGAIVGFTGSIAAKNVGIPLSGLRLFAGVFLVFLGLYLGQWLMWIARVEKLGQKLWRYLSPISKRFIPVDNTKKALSLGALWGWLPCGLIYSTLTWALASNSALQGAGIMFSFGLGTLPALVTISLGLLHVKKLLTNPIFRKSMALLVLLYGIYTIIFASKHLF